MSYSSELTKERILVCAKEEFLKKGFVEANLREISKNARATTGAIYNYFKSKEDLFEMIVGEFATKLFSCYASLHDSVSENYDSASYQTMNDINKGTMLILDLIYQNFELARLLFCCSKGSKYEKFAEKMIEIDERSTIKVIEKSGKKMEKLDYFFIHVIATSGLNNMLEAIHHNLSRDEAIEYMNKIQMFYSAGSKAIFEQ